MPEGFKACQQQQLEEGLDFFPTHKASSWYIKLLGFYPALKDQLLISATGTTAQQTLPQDLNQQFTPVQS